MTRSSFELIAFNEHLFEWEKEGFDPDEYFKKHKRKELTPEFHAKTIDKIIQNIKDENEEILSQDETDCLMLFLGEIGLANENPKIDLRKDNDLGWLEASINKILSKYELGKIYK